MRRLLLALLALFVAGCGGRSVAVPPLGGSSGGTVAAQARSPQSTAPGGTLFVANADRVNAIALAADGSPGEPQTVASGFFRSHGPGPGSHDDSRLMAIAARPGGTVGVMAQYEIEGCRIGVYSPSAGSGYAVASAGPQCRNDYGIGLNLRPSGAVDYLVGGASVKRYRADGTTIARGALAGQNTTYEALAEDAEADVFVSAQLPNRVEEYATAGAGIGAAPVRTLNVPGVPVGVAVAGDGTVYAGGFTFGAQGSSVTSFIYAFAPGATTPSRTIGPFTGTAGGSGDLTALAVDAQCRLYAAVTNTGLQTSHIFVYAGDADGAAAPLRTIRNPIPYDGRTAGQVVGLAFSPP